MASGNSHNGWLGSLGVGFGPPLTVVPEQSASSASTSSSSIGPTFEPLDRTAVGSNTLKRNPKMELTKSDLLKLLTYFEGEIQARDVVIAALKSEKLKQVVNVGRYRPAVLSDPYTALLRDSIGDGPTVKPPFTERDMALAAEQQLQALEHLAVQQRRAHQHMVNILRDAEAKHKKVIQDLEEEKCKHEHDTAQGDDITYGLEMERTRLRQELEFERTSRKKFEKELKKQIDMSDEERARQKQIVLLLLAERKKIIVKYIEERKRSEDLAQILSEEKSRIDTMAEGLEEESKKSLQMEAELEKQMHVFEAEKKTMKAALATTEARCQDLEAELQKSRAECELLRTRLREPVDGTAPMTSTVAKVVQPTATVSSVPVSGPTTGVAQSVTAGQGLRPMSTPPTTKVAPGMKMGAGLGGARGRNAPAPATTAASAPLPPTPTPAPPSTAPAVVTPAPTPPKKDVAALGRGAPPPIPPNKPIIVSKAPARRDTPDERKRPAARDPPISGATSSTTSAGIEMLGQELADFQQMLVTMATSNNT